MHQDLIYDVGMHTGEDSAFYLALGFRVVAIEANPDLAARARERFARAIEQQRLSIVEAAIAPQPGRVEFWINRQNSEWSALDPAMAARRGERCEPVVVPARTFRSILDEFGPPFYLKIDVEQADLLCLDAIDPRDPPAFVSVEATGDQLLPALVQKGYTCFKIIRQTDLRPIAPGDRVIPPGVAPPRWARHAPAPRLAAWLAQRPASLARKIRRALRIPAHSPKPTFPMPDGSRWTFPPASSGPTPDATPGPWLDHADASCVLNHIADGAAILGHAAHRVWFDIHAARPV